MNLNIKENSWIAKLAAKKLQSNHIGIVIGNTIHLHNTTREDFLQNEKWVKHEICHLQQFKKHGKFIFIIKYVWESVLHGYYNNKYEVEARRAEES
jgi:hypothetical protein